MKRLWDKGVCADERVIQFTVGEDYVLDHRLVLHDIRASIAHVAMLGACGHLDELTVSTLQTGLEQVGKSFEAGEWGIAPEEEDCHTAIENRLTELLGSVAGSVHLGRSRNDQVLAALRLYLRQAGEEVARAAQGVVEALQSIADDEGQVQLPGYTHGQRAMPSTVALWASGFAAEIVDAQVGIRASLRRALKNPLGSAAGYGTPGLDLDRGMTTTKLGFAEAHEPVTAVQVSRGKAEASLAFECALLQQDLGRIASEICLFATAEFGFVSLPERFTTGSSIMPQKRNPDVFELVRGRSAQAMSEVQAILALTAKLPSGYHRDLQLIKPPLFRIIDSTLELCEVMAHVLPHIRFQHERTAACIDPTLYAAEEAFRLVQAEGIPFREAYRRVAESFQSDSQA